MFNPKTVPVWNIRKPRGGFTYFRRMRTIAARSLSQVLDGEPGARPSQNIRNLPSNWDDYAACFQRTWKVFGKRRKAWDR